MRRDLTELKNYVKKTGRRPHRVQGLSFTRASNQNVSIAEVQDRISDLESACLEMKDTLLILVKHNTEMQNNTLTWRATPGATTSKSMEYQKIKQGGWFHFMLKN